MIVIQIVRSSNRVVSTQTSSEATNIDHTYSRSTELRVITFLPACGHLNPSVHGLALHWICSISSIGRIHFSCLHSSYHSEIGRTYPYSRVNCMYAVRWTAVHAAYQLCRRTNLAISISINWSSPHVTASSSRPRGHAIEDQFPIRLLSRVGVPICLCLSQNNLLCISSNAQCWPLLLCIRIVPFLSPRLMKEGFDILQPFQLLPLLP